MAELKKQGEFSVWWWDVDGTQHEELRFVTAETAMSRVMALVRGPASTMGLVSRVIITDGGDCTNLEWKKDLGIVFPPPEK